MIDVTCNHLNYFEDNTFRCFFGKYNNLFFKNFKHFFPATYKDKSLRQQSYENKHFNNILANRVLKVKNSPLELEQYFKPINVSIDNMDKFKEKEVTKK